MNAKLWAALAIAVILLVFTAQNYRVVELRFLFWQAEISGAALIFVVLAAGVGIGWLISGFSRASRQP